jgi:hypothetical protein
VPGPCVLYKGGKLPGSTDIKGLFSHPSRSRPYSYPEYVLFKLRSDHRDVIDATRGISIIAFDQKVERVEIIYYG